jgi:hypothetical protein
MVIIMEEIDWRLRIARLVFSQQEVESTYSTGVSFRAWVQYFWNSDKKLYLLTVHVV